MAERSDIFIAYCFPEKRWLDRVQAELDAVVGSGRCVVWDERKLKTGVMWKTELPEVLAGAKVAMMIVSDLFLESEFVTRAKLPALLELERKNGLEICWVLASHCLFELAGLKESDAGNRVSAALDGLGSAQRDAEAAAVARKVAGLLGIAPPPPAEIRAAKTSTPASGPTAPKQTRKKRREAAAKAPAPESDLPTVPVAEAPAATPPAAPTTPIASVAAPVTTPEPAPAPAAFFPAVPSPTIPPPAPAAPLPASPAAPPPPTPPPPIPTASASPSKPLAAATAAVGLEPAPAPAAIATLTHSLDATIQIRQATVLKLSRLARRLLFAAGAVAFAAIVVAFLQGFTHFLLVAGFAVVVAGLALRLHARSRSLGQGLVGMRYTRSGLADEALLSRQREALMRKADEYLAQN